MALSQIFEAWSETVKAYAEAAGDEPPTCEFTSNAVSNQQAAPRIVMVPMMGTIGDSVGQAGFGDGIPEPRSLKAQKLRVDFRIWGNTIDECEALMNHTAAALHDLGWGADAAVAVDWTRGQSSTAKSGWLVVLTTTIEIPLVRELPTTAKIGAFTPMDQAIVSPS